APSELRTVDVVEHLDRPMPRNLQFADADGRRVELGRYFSGRRPVVLTLVYFECPMLCNLVLAGLTKSIVGAGVSLGNDFDPLTVSIDPSDEPPAAAARRKHYLDALGVSGEGGGWPFLTGDAGAIRALADAAGFVYAPVPHAREFAHPAVAIVLTPDGVVS